MESLGAYLQVFKNNGYPEFTLRHFRKHYPNAPIYLVSDNGYDFSALAASQECGYEHSRINLGVKPLGFSKEEMMEWMGRVKRGMEYCNTEFVLYLEDDILVRGVLDIDPTACIAGFKGNTFPQEMVNYFKAKYGAGCFNSTNYGACGGTIYHRKTFLNNFERMVEIVDRCYVEVVTNISYLFAHFDCSMTVMYMTMGYPYNINRNLVGTVNSPDWRNLDAPLVHMQKKRADDPIQQQVMLEFGT